MVYLHIPMAFNSIMHSGFSLKWQQVGVVENLYKLYKDYITSRVQCVVIDMVTCCFRHVISAAYTSRKYNGLLFIHLVCTGCSILCSNTSVFDADNTKLSKELHSTEGEV